MKETDRFIDRLRRRQAKRVLKHMIKDLPGDPGNRSIMATDADDKAVAKEFRTSPSSLWVITTTRVIERKAFMDALAIQEAADKKKSQAASDEEAKKK